MIKGNKRRLLCLLATLLGLTANAEVRLDPRLLDFAEGRTDEVSKRVVVVMEDAARPNRYPHRYASKEVTDFLKERTKASWTQVRDALRSRDAINRSVRVVKVHWINNTFTADVTKDGLRELAYAPLVSKIYYNGEVRLERPFEGSDSRWDEDSRSLPYPFKDTGLDRLMQEQPGITGEGIVLGSVDTGVDGRHPSLQGKVLTFYNGSLRKVDDPIDTDGHGTHTAGTMVGGDRSNDVYSMAPGAKLIAAGALDDYDSMIKGMEFMLDPDSNPQTVDSPRAINNSWNCGGAPDIELFYRAISAWEAAGILPVFSAGNSGPGRRTITPPHEHPSVLAVGATGEDGKIADFSSRGPGRFHGKDTEKPDLTAPGENIYSTLPRGRYGKLSGTSMAAPHVTGAVALILQVNPRLNPTQIRQVLTKTVTSMDEDGNVQAGNGPWNAVYGLGKMDIYRAVRTTAELTRAEEAMENSWYDLGGILFQSPQAIDARAFFSAPGNVEAGTFQYPREWDGTAWVSANQVF